MEELFLLKFWEGIKIFLGSIDYLFLAIFMIVTYLVLDSVESELKKLKDKRKMITSASVFLFGIILAFPYAYISEKSGKSGVAELFYTVIAGMVLYKFGVDKLFAWTKTKKNQAVEKIKEITK